MRDWARRAAALHRELAELADLRADPRWWLLAGGAAITWPSRTVRYVISDAEPAADTFIGYAEPPPRDAIVHAVARAYAARAALRALDGRLPDQQLAVTVQRNADGAVRVPSELDVAAFAIGAGCWCAPLGADDDRDHAKRIVRDLWWVLGEIVNARMVSDMRAAGVPIPQRERPATVDILRTLGSQPIPFVTITIGDEPIATARHGHRRAWSVAPAGAATGTTHENAGPWLGLSSSHDERNARLAIVSTCHFVVDGFGHAHLANDIATRTSAWLATSSERTRIRPPSDRPAVAAMDPTQRDRVNADVRRAAHETVRASRHPPDATSDPRVQLQLPVPSIVRDLGALGVAWRELGVKPPRAIALAYALGIVLHRAAARSNGGTNARFSPTIQIPVAPGARNDADRHARRVVPAITSVRFEHGVPEPFDSFAARTREALAREADGTGLTARMLAAMQAVPAPVAWKRRAVGPARSRWFETLADLIGGRGCVSRIRIDSTDAIALCAVSSPAQLATLADELGGCVVTVIDHGQTAAITLCGSGLAGSHAAANQLLDELLETVGHI